ncbi:electron transport complex subunit RsxA [bacterium Unc6]|nr:electron transport complex subunit RsxA [bacterium Unc6]
MEFFVRLFFLFLSAILVNNFVLSRFLGLCSFIGVSRKTEVALGMGAAVIFVITIASIITWPVYNFVLVPAHLEFLNILTFILVIASFVQLVEMFIKKFYPPLYKSLGIYLPLITVNCIVLFVALLNVQQELTFVESVFQSIGAGVGYALAIVLLTTIRERLELVDIPESLKGAPIAFIIAGLMALAFQGFQGLIPITR